MARLCDEAEIPVLLVGDSLGNVILGHETTVPVTMDDMIHHAAAVVRARPRALVVVDMPFLSFQVSPERALECAGRIVQETGADAVKLEGGRRTAEAVRRIVEAGVPVMGHLGLTPQSVLEFGGYGVQGRGRAGEILLEEAKVLEAAGVFSLVLEKVPAALAARITRAVSVPTIGIGAGAQCDGQVLVLYDLLGLVPSFRPRFVKRYAEFGTGMVEALRRYRDDVKKGSFPGAEHAYADEPEAKPQPVAKPQSGAKPQSDVKPRPDRTPQPEPPKKKAPSAPEVKPPDDAPSDLRVHVTRPARPTSPARPPGPARPTRPRGQRRRPR
jgi:3-methyl-2-oxobutanoate hydroxymethyltransferase